MIHIDRSFQIMSDINTKVNRGFDNKIVFKTEAKRTTLVSIFFLKCKQTCCAAVVFFQYAVIIDHPGIAAQ